LRPKMSRVIVDGDLLIVLILLVLVRSLLVLVLSPSMILMVLVNLVGLDGGLVVQLVLVLSLSMSPMVVVMVIPMMGVGESLSTNLMDVVNRIVVVGVDGGLGLAVLILMVVVRSPSMIQLVLVNRIAVGQLDGQVWQIEHHLRLSLSMSQMVVVNPVGFDGLIYGRNLVVVLVVHLVVHHFGHFEVVGASQSMSPMVVVEVIPMVAVEVSPSMIQMDVVRSQIVGLDV